MRADTVSRLGLVACLVSPFTYGQLPDAVAVGGREVVAWLGAKSDSSLSIGVYQVGAATDDNQADSEDEASSSPVDCGAGRGVRPIVRHAPNYPPGALRKGTEGWVRVRLSVTKSGQPTDVEAIDSDPRGVFEEAAFESVRRWKYTPRTDNGVAVDCVGLETVIKFALGTESPQGPMHRHSPDTQPEATSTGLDHLTESDRSGVSAGSPDPLFAAGARQPLYRQFGSYEERVKALQRLLRSTGVYRVPIDGQFGAATDRVLKHFLSTHPDATASLGSGRWVANAEQLDDSVIAVVAQVVQSMGRTLVGRGTYTERNGVTYDGDWLDGLPHGVGVFRYPDGSRYEGQVANGQRHGTGIHHEDTGEIYEGQWADGKIHGAGKLTSAAGDVTTGTWSSGQLIASSPEEPKRRGSPDTQSVATSPRSHSSAGTGDAPANKPDQGVRSANSCVRVEEGPGFVQFYNECDEAIAVLPCPCDLPTGGCRWSCEQITKLAPKGKPSGPGIYYESAGGIMLERILPGGQVLQAPYRYAACYIPYVPGEHTGPDKSPCWQWAVQQWDHIERTGLDPMTDPSRPGRGAFE